jgi:ABC-type oligopeptide transport system substrate-binding subunit
MRRRITMAAGMALAVLTALVLAACGSSSTSGTQSFHGSTTDLSANALPLKASGVVNTTGSLVLNNSSATKSTIKTTNGDVYVTHNNPNTAPSVNSSACTASEVTKGTYKVTGGTGSFNGATGSGNYTITFNGKFALTGGKCVITQNSSPESGTESFDASGPLTVS